MRNSFILKDISEIAPMLTSHGVGQKQVLLTNQETVTAITQIAVTTLREKEIVDVHLHPTMDEHYFFLSGKGEMKVGDEDLVCKSGLYILIPAKIAHSLKATTELKFITIGIAL